MAIQLFRLRGVPDDEAAEVRALLDSNGIEYYETSAGNWGISMPALWLKDERQLQQARGLIARYQEERFVRERERYRELKRVGRQRTIVDVIREDPVRFVVYVAVIVVVAYLSMKPFIDFGK